MKKLQVMLSALLVLVLVQSCLGDDGPPYDAEAQLALDLEAIDAYVATNSLTVEIDEDSEIRYIIEEEGNGTEVEVGDTVYVDYELYLLNGKFIDTSVEQTAKDNNGFDPNRTYKPFGFIIGKGMVIPGFDYATRLLTEEGKGTFLIPSVLAYQYFGSGNIPPHASLRFKIKLNEIDK